jgi:O-antigen/teichoic acid export membrane protein
VGSILVLLVVARSVVVFYWWQLVFALVELVICVVAVQRYGLGFTGRAGAFDAGLLRGLWRFSLNVGGMSMFALALKQIDKLIVSTVLPISYLGYYNAATLASNGLSKVGQPIQTAVFPRLTQLHERAERESVATTFHHAVQLTALLTVPLACGLLFFPAEVLWMWTHDSALVSNASGALAVLSGAMLLNGMMSVPFSLMLASGMTRLPLAMNAGGAVLLTPITYVLAQRYGLLGASVGWLLFNVMYFLIVPPVMLHRLLPGNYGAWLTRDTLPFIAAGLASFGAAKWLAADAALPLKVGAAGMALVVYGIVAIASTPGLRRAILAGRDRPLAAQLKALFAGKWSE